MTLGLKYLLYLTGQFFDLKNIPFRYYEFLVANNTYLWDYLHHKDGYRQKLLCMHHNSVLGHFSCTLGLSTFFFYMKLGLIVLSKFQDTLVKPDMLENYLCLYQTKMEIYLRKILQCYKTVI